MRRSPAAALLIGLSLAVGACATGEHVYVSGRADADDDDDDSSAPPEGSAGVLLAAAGPGALLARGNALLPGAVVGAAPARPIRTGPANALVNATLLPRGMTGAGAPVQGVTLASLSGPGASSLTPAATGPGGGGLSTAAATPAGSASATVTPPGLAVGGPAPISATLPSSNLAAATPVGGLTGATPAVGVGATPTVGSTMLGANLLGATLTPTTPPSTAPTTLGVPGSAPVTSAVGALGG